MNNKLYKVLNLNVESYIKWWILNKYIKKSHKNLWGGFANDYSVTAGGILFTTFKNGNIKSNGTSTGGAYSLTSSNAISQGIYKMLEAGNYSISGGTNNCRIQVIKTSGEQITSTNSTSTFSLTENTNIFIRVQIITGLTVDNEIVYPKLYKIE